MVDDASRRLWGPRPSSQCQQAPAWQHALMASLVHEGPLRVCAWLGARVQACNLPLPRQQQTHKAPSGAPYLASMAQTSVDREVSCARRLLDDASMCQLPPCPALSFRPPKPLAGGSSTFSQQCCMECMQALGQWLVTDLCVCVLLCLLAGTQS